MDEIKAKIDEVIKQEIDGLASLTGDDRRKAIDNLVKLHDLRIDEVKVQTEAIEGSLQKEMEAELKRDQLNEAAKDRYCRVGVEVAGIVLPLVFYGIWMRRGFKFEESGTFTSTTFRNLFGRFRPTK